MKLIKGKHISYLLVITIALLAFSCHQEKYKLNSDDVNYNLVQIAESFTNDFFYKSREGDTLDFENRVSVQMSNVFNKKEQFPLYQEFKEQVGDYVKSMFEEAWYVKGIKLYNVFRFKAEFDGADKLQEIRVVLDENNLVSGYYVGPWDDEY